MLLSLHIENIAIIEKSDIDFSDGFNVLTGETGAGKSIIIDSINLLMGSKSSKELIGPYNSYALVSAVFTEFTEKQAKMLEEIGIIPDDDGNIIISRKITGDGRNITKINGCGTTVSALKEAAALLVSIHGQHDGVRILDPGTHLEYLDEFCKIEPYISYYREKYESVKKIRKNLDKLNEIKNKKADMQSALMFKIDELKRADLKPGEYEKLKNARVSAQNSALIANALYNSEELLSRNDDSILSMLGAVTQELGRITDVLPGADKPLRLLSGIKAELEEAAASVSELLSEHEESEYTPDYIESRLFSLESIIKKYSGEQNAIDALVQYKNELAALDDNDAELEQTAVEYRSSLKDLEALAHKLSEIRKTAAEKLANDICFQLRELDMPQVKFEVRVTRNTNSRGGYKYTANGYDCVEFLASANLGLEPKPISKIASGGELSRIMLCLKNTLNGSTSDCSSIIYDEIDTGVSGSTAQKIGRKLKSSAQNKQVFCVTHLAQIAAMADHHYKVEKVTDNLKTYSKIRLLTDDERKIEVARIMGGVEITDQLIKTADELINSVK